MALPSEQAKEFAKNLYKSLCLQVILSAGSEYYTEDTIEKILSLVEISPDDEKNVN